MIIEDHMSLCKRTARRIKSDHPDDSYTKRLDIAAKRQGFKHYTALKKLHDILEPNTAPSRVEILKAGGNPKDCPYTPVHSTANM